MYNQGPTVGRINPAFTGPQNEQDHLEKSGMGQSVPPPYYVNTGVNPVPSGFPNQPYGAPGGPQGPYAQQSYPGIAVYPQAAYVDQTGVTVQPTVFMTPTPPASPMPDYMCYSVFTLLCCCLPLGIAAAVCSCNTQDANVSGQRELAMRSSRAALILNHVALGVGILIITVATVVILFAYGVFY